MLNGGFAWGDAIALAVLVVFLAGGYLVLILFLREISVETRINKDDPPEKQEEQREKFGDEFDRAMLMAGPLGMPCHYLPSRFD